MSWIDIGLIMGLIYAWAVLGFVCAFRLFRFPDLTIEGSVPLGAAVYAAMLRGGWATPEAVVLAIASGMLAGAVTASLHARFQVNKFLAGILVVAVAYSLTLRVLGGSNIGLLTYPTPFDFVAWLDRLIPALHTGKLVVLALLALVIVGVCMWALSTRPGLRLRAVGSNSTFASMLGVNVGLHLVVGLAICNGLGALSGVLLAMHSGFADVGLGQGVLILALAAMTIGERLLPQRHLRYQAYVVLSAIIGSVGYQLLVALAVYLGLAPSDLKLVTALLVLFVVALRLRKDEQMHLEFGA